MTLLFGAENARDLGGYATKSGQKVATGRVYRSDSLSRLTEQDLTTMGNWGLMQVLDLRGHPEVAALGADRLPSGVTWRHLPIYDDTLDIYGVWATLLGGADSQRQADLLGNGGATRMMIDMYRWFVTHPDSRRQFGAAMTTLAQPHEVPILFHCTAGKDRTGWLAAVMLMALGVDEEVVYADYLRTNDAIAASSRMLAMLQEKGIVHDVDIFMPLIEVRAEYLHASFAEVTKSYGDIETFVTEGLGVDIHALRGNLLEGDVLNAM